MKKTEKGQEVQSNKKKISVKEILTIDCRKQENKEKLQQVLRKIKPLSKCTDDVIPMEMLEKFVNKVVIKYSVEIQWITYTLIKNNVPYWSVSIKEGSPTHTWLSSIHAVTLYELMSKVCILLYANIKKGKLRLRGDNNGTVR